MIYLLAALVVVLIVKDAWMSRQRDTENERWRLLWADALRMISQERDAHREAFNGLVQVIERERDARRAETARLLQRIQAPEQAVVEHQVERAMQYEMPQPPQTDEEFAEYREQAELIRQMEAAENAHLQEH